MVFFRMKGSVLSGYSQEQAWPQAILTSPPLWLLNTLWHRFGLQATDLYLAECILRCLALSYQFLHLIALWLLSLLKLGFGAMAYSVVFVSHYCIYALGYLISSASCGNGYWHSWCWAFCSTFCHKKHIWQCDINISHDCPCVPESNGR